MTSLAFIYKGQISIAVEGDYTTIEKEMTAALRAAEQAIALNPEDPSQAEPETTTPPTIN